LFDKKDVLVAGSELYALLNYLALLLGFVLYLWMARFDGRWTEIFFVLSLVAAFLALFLVSDVYPILNSLLLLLSLRHIFANKKTMLRVYAGFDAKRSAVWAILLFLIALTYVFSGIRGWQSVMVTSLRYWIILLSFFGWRSTGSIGEKTIFTTMLLVLGVIWGSKIVIVCGAVMFAFQFIKVSSLKNRLVLSGIIFFSLLIIWVVFNDQVQTFLTESVLRPDYDRDVKVLGLSDGSRITLWTDYLEGAHLFGKGDYLGQDLAPTHNIFVYFVYEFGVFPASLASAVLLRIAYGCARSSGIEFLLVLSFCFLLSSVFEYGTGWVVPLIAIPFFATKRVQFKLNA
jgi:hypothetical protein